jgi:hypothetical protein
MDSGFALRAPRNDELSFCVPRMLRSRATMRC